MPEEYRNIYKIARRAAGLTQEAAAERLDISVESIRAYETGQRVPPDAIVEQMVICYNAQYLAVQHLRESNTLAARIVPPLEERNVMEIVVRLYNRLKRLETGGSVDRLLEIAEDGIIDEGERAEYLAIVADIRELVKTGMELEVIRPEE